MHANPLPCTLPPTQVNATVYVPLPANNGGAGKATQITSLTVMGEDMMGGMMG